MQSNKRKDLTSERSDTPSNVFSIPSGAAFLRTLAEAIVSGQLEAGDETLATRNPNWLADGIIFLPTRRAARALGVELLCGLAQNLYRWRRREASPAHCRH